MICAQLPELDDDATEAEKDAFIKEILVENKRLRQENEVLSKRALVVKEELPCLTARQLGILSCIKGGSCHLPNANQNKSPGSSFIMEALVDHMERRKAEGGQEWAIDAKRCVLDATNIAGRYSILKEDIQHLSKNLKLIHFDGSPITEWKNNKEVDRHNFSTIKVSKKCFAYNAMKLTDLGEKALAAAASASSQLTVSLPLFQMGFFPGLRLLKGRDGEMYIFLVKMRDEQLNGLPRWLIRNIKSITQSAQTQERLSVHPLRLAEGVTDDGPVQDGEGLRKLYVKIVKSISNPRSHGGKRMTLEFDKAMELTGTEDEVAKVEWTNEGLFDSKWNKVRAEERAVYTMAKLIDVIKCSKGLKQFKGTVSIYFPDPQWLSNRLKESATTETDSGIEEKCYHDYEDPRVSISGIRILTLVDPKDLEEEEWDLVEPFRRLFGIVSKHLLPREGDIFPTHGIDSSQAFGTDYFWERVAANLECLALNMRADPNRAMEQYWESRFGFHDARVEGDDNPPLQLRVNGSQLAQEAQD